MNQTNLTLLQQLPPVKRIPSLREIYRLRPEVKSLVAEAEALKAEREQPFCANVAIARLKPRLERVVGWYARTKHPRLRTSRVYEFIWWSNLRESAKWSRLSLPRSSRLVRQAGRLGDRKAGAWPVGSARDPGGSGTDRTRTSGPSISTFNVLN